MRRSATDARLVRILTCPLQPVLRDEVRSLMVDPAPREQPSKGRLVGMALESSYPQGSHPRWLLAEQTPSFCQREPSDHA